MNMLRNVAHELIGLFVDDGAFAVAILAVVILAAVAAALPPEQPLITGAILLLGCLGVLSISVAKAARRR
jgi:hypothetical protein